MSNINNEFIPSDLLLVGEFLERGYNVHEITQQCSMQIDKVRKLKKEVELNQQKELGSNPVIVIYRAIDALEKRYRHLIEIQSEQQDKVVDVKMMQGEERCLELKMKLLGFDGKQPFKPTEVGCSGVHDDIVIDLKTLSKQTIRELSKLVAVASNDAG